LWRELIPGTTVGTLYQRTEKTNATEGNPRKKNDDDV
jgi:hypothetical protein